MLESFRRRLDVDVLELLCCGPVERAPEASGGIPVFAAVTISARQDGDASGQEGEREYLAFCRRGGGRTSLPDFLNGVELCILPLLGFPGQSSPEFTVLSLGVPSWPHPYRCVLSHSSASTVLRVPSVSYSGVSHSVSPTAFVA